MTRINPNASIRSGYTFEDLYVLKFCVEWLLEPKAYTQIEIQYDSPEINVKHFAIDDVRVTRSDGMVEYYQLKHRQHPERDLWDLSELIKKGLLKWIKSYLSLCESGPTVCALISNGKVSDKLALALRNEKLDRHAIASAFPELYQELSIEFSDPELDKFFNEFYFKFDKPGITLLESALREKLYKQLKATKAGVDSLLLYIIAQGSQMYPKVFTLDEIRSCLSWDNPRPLNQNFEIPEDFEFFDRGFHEKLLNELKSVDGGIKVFTGKPGSGKSTYLSKLYTVLKKSGIMTFRHHYHLNPKDKSFAERLNSDRVKEALKAEFKKQKNSVIGTLGEINTQHTEIKEFIDRIATYHRDRGTTFVIIVDGLDHVIREGKNRETLVDFLNDLLYPQAGFWLIFGTQEMATPCFPRIVEEYAPKADWIEVKGLNRSQVTKIAKKAFPQLNSKHKEYFKESINILFKLSAGNPLHLRYVLTEIKNTGNELYNYDLERIQPYGGDISTYYNSLWCSLSELAKSLCYAITALDFKLHKEQLFSLAANLTPYPSEVSNAFKDIAHLIRIELSGISVYHNSFQVFMTNQPELKEQQRALYLTLKEWLKSPSQEGLRWSESAKIEYYLGNPDLLLALDNEWIVTSYLGCRDQHQIQRILDLAIKAAFEFNVPEKVVYFSVVSSYFANREYNLSETLDSLWSTAFKAKSDLNISYPDFSTLSHCQIKEILIHLKHKGLIADIPNEAIDRMNMLFRDYNVDNAGLVKSWIEVLIAFPKNEQKGVFNFIKQFRKSGESGEFMAIYLKQLFASHNCDSRTVEAILRLKLITSERKALLEVLMHRDMQSGIYEWSDLIRKIMRSGSGLVNYYTLFAKLGSVQSKALPDAEDFPDEYDYHGSAKSVEAISMYERTFDAAYFSVISGNEKLVDKWLKNRSNRWPVQFAKVVIRIASMLADHFSSTRRIKLSDMLVFFDELRQLDFSHDFKIYELKRAIVPYIIDKAVWLAQITNVRNGKEPELTKPEFDSLYHFCWYYRSRMFNLVNEGRLFVSEDALGSFRDQELVRLKENISPFGDKAKEMMNLALLYKDFQKGIHLPRLLQLTAENMLGYGYHKDMFMYNILQGIEILIESKSVEVGRYLDKLMPYVYYIERLTDGDETGHFMSRFYLLLASYDKQLLYNFYLHRLDTREYIDSDLLWGSIVHTLDLDDPIAAAVANTAIDHMGFTSLMKDSNKPGVSNIIAAITSKFGELDYSGKKEKNSSYSREEPKDSSYLKVLPGNLLAYFLTKKVEDGFRRFDERHFLSNWARHWLRHSAYNTSEILHEIKNILADKPWDYGKGVLEIMYPYAIKTDKNLAFYILCWQMVTIGGWNSNYLTPMEEVRPIWQEVIQHFPLRSEEFYKWTIMYSGLRYGEELDYSLPMPKSIQYFSDSDQLERAERLMEYYLDSLSGLFPNVNLPVPEFWTTPKPVTAIDLLFRRLEWMSPLVRCRAAEGIADLMVGDEAGTFHEKFYEWLKSCELESVACHGLIIIIRSLQVKRSFTFKHLGQFRLGNLIKVRCMATDLLLMRIAELLGIRLFIDIPHIIQMSSELPEIDLEHFKKLISRNLTISYLNYLDELEENCPFSVWQVWLCMYKERCEEMGLIYGSDDERYENQGQSVIIGRNTIFAEILKSTFFIILDYMYDMGLIDYGELFRMTLKNLPIDPSVWAVSPTKKPMWWPNLKMPLLKPGDAYPDLTELLRKSFANTADETVLSMHATFFEGKDFYTAETYCAQEVIAFAYPTGYLPKISVDQIFRELTNVGFFYPQIEKVQNFGALDNDLVYYGEQICSNNIQPLTVILNIDTHHIWEHYRIFNRFRLLHPFLGDCFNIEKTQDSISYFDNGKVVSKSADFMFGLRETRNPHMPLIPHSNFLIISTSYLNEILKKKGLALAYAVKEEFWYKDKPYLDKWPKPHVRFRLILEND